MKIEFSSDPHCTCCEISTCGCTSVCIPARPYRTNGHPTALLIIGEAPGRQEDIQRKCFVGPTGQHLMHTYCDGMSLEKHADIYFANAIRCNPMGLKPTPKKHLRRCKEAWLYDDLNKLRKEYTDVVILCVGAIATQSILEKTLSGSFAQQGKPTEIDGHSYRVFSTWHPAGLLPGRTPANIHAVESHLNLLIEQLDGQSMGPEVFPYEVGTYPWPYPHKLICIDIETYGAVEGFPSQNYFHPAKSRHLDGVLRR